MLLLKINYSFPDPAVNQLISGLFLSISFKNIGSVFTRFDFLIIPKPQTMRLNHYLAFLFFIFISPGAHSQVLNKQSTLNKFSFWENKDWSWYKENIPFLETPDRDIDMTYYYRWDMMTLHLVYGSTTSGYTVTEFIDRPWWAGRYGAISCSVSQHMYDMRWMRDQSYVKDYARYWFNTPGAQPRSYSTWLADAIWQLYKVNYDRKLVLGLKDDLVANFAGWEKEHWIEKEGLFAWSGMHDGMETNINSRQTPQWFEGASGYRPTLNSYMWADAKAISSIAALAGDKNTDEVFTKKAELIRTNYLKKGWNEKKNFFMHKYEKDEEGGIKANTFTYETGKYAGNIHGREEIGFVPWYFNMPLNNEGYEKAWQYLMDPHYFFSPYGPTTVEKNDPLYMVAKNCCAWSGNAWPFATAQTLKAMANVVRNYNQNFVNKEDYHKQLQIYARTHRKDNKPYIAEANEPETGSWSGHDIIGHSEHYNHSSYIDQIVTGLMGLEPKDADSLEVNPLIPDEWAYACLDDVIYHGNKVTIIWDKTGTKYKKGKGLLVLVNGEVRASSPVIKKLVIPVNAKAIAEKPVLVNYAVNNEQGVYYPRAKASFPGSAGDVEAKLNDGQYWYVKSTTNRWSSLYAKGNKSWAEIDFGGDRPFKSVKIYFTDDKEDKIKAPLQYTLEYWNGKTWAVIPGQQRQYKQAISRKANEISFPLLSASKIRVVMTASAASAVSISEIEAWGPLKEGLTTLPAPANTNMAYKDVATFSASYYSKFDEPGAINNGFTDPNARWTAYLSPEPTDWVQFDLNKVKTVKEVRMYVFDDHGGTQAPLAYTVEYWDGKNWAKTVQTVKIPVKPVAHLNLCLFTPIKTDKIRITVTHKDPAKKVFSGFYEVELY